MREKYCGYCMKFSNEEIKKYLIDEVKKYFNIGDDIRVLSEDGEEVDINSDTKIETVVFDGEKENLFINFYDVHTSIFVYDEEIMFIDEDSKGIYTSSDVYNSVVYEGDLRGKSHMQILQMFAEIVLCFVGAKGIQVIQNDVGTDKQYKRYNYYEPHMFVLNVKNDNQNIKTNIYENITINY